jgi:G3E family GTPase
LPKPLVQAFAWPEVRTRVTVDGVVAVVDAEAAAEGRFAPDLDALAAQRAADPSLDHDSPLAELFEEQVLCADLVVLNKLDRVDAAGRDRAEAEVARHLRPGRAQRPARFGAVDPRVSRAWAPAPRTTSTAAAPRTPTARTGATSTTTSRASPSTSAARWTRPTTSRRG